MNDNARNVHRLVPSGWHEDIALIGKMRQVFGFGKTVPATKPRTVLALLLAAFAASIFSGLTVHILVGSAIHDQIAAEQNAAALPQTVPAVRVQRMPMEADLWRENAATHVVASGTLTQETLRNYVRWPVFIACLLIGFIRTRTVGDVVIRTRFIWPAIALFQVIAWQQWSDLEEYKNSSIYSADGNDTAFAVLVLCGLSAAGFLLLRRSERRTLAQVPVQLAPVSAAEQTSHIADTQPFEPEPRAVRIDALARESTAQGSHRIRYIAGAALAIAILGGMAARSYLRTPEAQARLEAAREASKTPTLAPYPVSDTSKPIAQSSDQVAPSTTIETSSGVLTITTSATDDFSHSVVLNGTTLLSKDLMNIEVPFTNPASKPSLLVLQLEDGGRGCPAHFQVLDLRGPAPQLSPEIGPCYGDTPEFKAVENGVSLLVVSFEAKKPEHWVYTAASAAGPGHLTLLHERNTHDQEWQAYLDKMTSDSGSH